MITKNQPKRIASRVFWSVFFVAGALAALGTGFGFLDLGVPIGLGIAIIALAAVGLGMLFGRFWLGFLMISATIATIMGANDLFFSLSGEQIGTLYIAAGFLGVALHILFHRHDRKWRDQSCKECGGKGCKKCMKDYHADANFGGTTKYFNTEDFKSADVNCNFGGIKAYFDDAIIKGDKATINVSVNFGGVELFIPKHWKIDMQVANRFGGIEEENHPKVNDESPIVTLTGECNFAGITITYV